MLLQYEERRERQRQVKTTGLFADLLRLCLILPQRTRACSQAGPLRFVGEEKEETNLRGVHGSCVWFLECTKEIRQGTRQCQTQKLLLRLIWHIYSKYASIWTAWFFSNSLIHIIDLKVATIFSVVFAHRFVLRCFSWPKERLTVDVRSQVNNIIDWLVSRYYISGSLKLS